MTETMTSQNTDRSTWDTLYIFKILPMLFSTSHRHRDPFILHTNLMSQS
jgi:hypothetical protein